MVSTSRFLCTIWLLGYSTAIKLYFLLFLTKKFNKLDTKVTGYTLFFFMFIEANKSEQHLILNKVLRKTEFLITWCFVKKIPTYLFCQAYYLYLWSEMQSEREAWKKIIFPQSLAKIYIAYGKCLPQSFGSYISKSLLQSNNKAMSLMEIPFLLENGFWRDWKNVVQTITYTPFTITTCDHCRKNFTESSS